MFQNVVFFLKRSQTTHKLQYSKTLKGDWAGAIFGCLISIIVGYVTLSTFGGFSVDLVDLYHAVLSVVIVFLLLTL